MEKCEICKKEANENNPYWFSQECYYFCRKHTREVNVALKLAWMKYPKEIQNAKPTTKEWTKQCRLNERVVAKFVTTYPLPPQTKVRGFRGTS